MRSLGVPMEVEKVQVADIDLNEGLKRQARLLGKLNDDYVLQMAVAMEQLDAAFPMVILQKPPRGKLWPWSGNHRLASFCLACPNETFIDAYVISLKDPVMMDILPRVVNAWESGLGFSKEEKIANARWLMEQHSMTADEAAKMFGLKVDWLFVARRAETVRDYIKDVPKSDKIAKSTIIKMAPLAANTNVLKATANVLCKYGITGEDAILLITDVKNHSTELQQMAELGRWEKLIEERNRPKDKPKKTQSVHLSAGVRTAFVRHLTGLSKILAKANTREKLQCTDPADWSVVEKNWLEVSKVMTKVMEGVR